jgi:TRAP-type C4-dicarboxylate transport system substrate-binding protein
MTRLFIRSGLLAASLLATAAQAETIFKIATLAPDGTTWMKEMRTGAEAVEKQTEGRVKFKFYPGGIMGNDPAVLRKMRIGQLQGAAVTGNSLSEIYPGAQLYSLPLLFRSYAEVDYVRGKMDPAIQKGLEDAGLVPIGFTEGGFAYLFSQRSVSSQDELKKCKIWLPENDLVNSTAFQSAGVSPVPLPFADVYTGLQTGLVDTAVTLPTAAIAFQWHTKLKTFTDQPLSYIVGVLVINKKSFEQLSPADQATVRKTMADAFSRLNKLNREDNENARTALKKQGLEFNTLSPDEREKWQAFADDAIVKLKDRGVYNAPLLEELRGHLRYYRSTVAGQNRPACCGK